MRTYVLLCRKLWAQVPGAPLLGQGPRVAYEPIPGKGRQPREGFPQFCQTAQTLLVYKHTHIQTFLLWMYR